jgi:hypothetical protein
MKEQAIEKLLKEMEAAGGKRYVQVVGQMLIQAMDRYPDLAEKVLQEDKTIKESIEKMRDEAAKQKEGNVGILSDVDAMPIILKYYGVKMSSEVPAPAVAPAPAKPDFSVDLDTLLGI